MKQIKNLLPEWIKRPLRPIKLKISELMEYPIIYTQPGRHKKAIEKVRNKARNNERIRVAFFATHSSVWKYDGVYQLMDQDPRFEPIVIVCPVINYGKENMLVEMEKTFKMFQNKGYRVIKTYDEMDDSYLDVKKEIEPDIVFYTNPYRGLIHNEYYITNFKDILTCYVPYAFGVSNLYDQGLFNLLFHNILWKAFYETDLHKEMAKTYARNKGKNIVISGYPGIDNFIYGSRSGEYRWKNPDSSLKRMIWAPHHTIEPEGLLSYSNFLRYHQIMLDVAEKYKDKIQIAFKPHPLLRVKLYNHKDWGINKTDEYYKRWRDGSNTQLETGQYIDLFNTSDAMIFDSGGFTAEYLCCGKPSIFLLSDIKVKEQFNDFGKLALERHYHALEESDLFRFIDSVICEGKDYKSESRKNFYQTYLRSTDSSASQKIYNEICKQVIVG